jgi:hypothetical protein
LCSIIARTMPAVASGRSVSWSPFIASVERVHLLLDDVGHLAEAAHEQRRRLDDRRQQVLVAVARSTARTVPRTTATARSGSFRARHGGGCRSCL